MKNKFNVNKAESGGFINSMKINGLKNDQIIEECKKYKWDKPGHTATIRRLIRLMLAKETRINEAVEYARTHTSAEYNEYLLNRDQQN